MMVISSDGSKSPQCVTCINVLLLTYLKVALFSFYPFLQSCVGVCQGFLCLLSCHVEVDSELPLDTKL